MVALIRVEKEILTDEMEKVRLSSRSYRLFVLAFPPCLFLFSRSESFQESCGAYDCTAQTGFRREVMGKVLESTIHLAQPVWSLRLTWREEFTRFPDNESGNFPSGPEETSRHANAGTMRPLNIAPIREFVRPRRV